MGSICIKNLKYKNNNENKSNEIVKIEKCINGGYDLYKKLQYIWYTICYIIKDPLNGVDLIKIKHVYWAIPATLYLLLIEKPEIWILYSKYNFRKILFGLNLLYLKYHFDDIYFTIDSKPMWKKLFDEDISELYYLERELFKLLDFNLIKWPLANDLIYTYYYHQKTHINQILKLNPSRRKCKICSSESHWTELHSIKN